MSKRDSGQLADMLDARFPESRTVSRARIVGNLYVYKRFVMVGSDRKESAIIEFSYRLDDKKGWAVGYTFDNYQSPKNRAQKFTVLEYVVDDTARVIEELQRRYIAYLTEVSKMEAKYSVSQLETFQNEKQKLWMKHFDYSFFDIIG